MARSAAQKRALEEARLEKEEKRRAQEAKRQRELRLGEAIIEWEEDIERLRETLEPFNNPRGKVRSVEQNMMALQTALYYMEAARELDQGTEAGTAGV